METDKLITAKRTSAPLAADELDHEEWTRAQPVRLTRYWSGEAAPPARHAEARLLWSTNALHARFVYRQEEPFVRSSNPQRERKTLGLWDRDVCEIFIAADGQTPLSYLEFEAAPTGEWLDLAVQFKDGTRETDWAFDSGMTTAARISASTVTIALRIPWTAFRQAPQEGEQWRVNLFRCVGEGHERGYVAWQPTHTPQPNFHVPGAFGWLNFQNEIGSMKAER